MPSAAAAPAGLRRVSIPDALRDPSVEGLRGLAMTLVFLGHFGSRFAPGFPTDPAIQALGALPGIGFGSAVFLLLAGYYSYARFAAASETSIPDYVRRRLARLVPLYWFRLAIAFLTAAAGVSPHKIPVTDERFHFYILTNVALVAPLFALPTTLAVAWTLTFVLLAYVIMPPFARIAYRRVSGRNSRVALILATAALATLVDHWLPRAGCAALLFAGALLYELRQWHRIHDVLARVGDYAGIAAGVVLLVLSVSLKWPVWQASLFAAALLCALFTIVYQGRFNRLLRTPAPRWLGRMAYSYYLSHGLPLTLLQWIAPPGLTGASPSALWFWALLPAAYIASLATAWLMWIAVEHPLSRYVAPRKVGALAA